MPSQRLPQSLCVLRSLRLTTVLFPCTVPGSFAASRETAAFRMFRFSCGRQTCSIRVMEIAPPLPVPPLHSANGGEGERVHPQNSELCFVHAFPRARRPRSGPRVCDVCDPQQRTQAYKRRIACRFLKAPHRRMLVLSDAPRSSALRVHRLKPFCHLVVPSRLRVNQSFPFVCFVPFVVPTFRSTGNDPPRAPSRSGTTRSPQCRWLRGSGSAGSRRRSRRPACTRRNSPGPSPSTVG